MRGIHPAPTAKQGQYLLVNEAQLAPHPWGTPKAAAGKYQSGKNGEVILNLAGQVYWCPGCHQIWAKPEDEDKPVAGSKMLHRSCDVCCEEFTR